MGNLEGKSIIALSRPVRRHEYFLCLVVIKLCILLCLAGYLTQKQLL